MHIFHGAGWGSPNEMRRWTALNYNLPNFQWAKLDAWPMCLSRIFVILRTCDATTTWCRLQNGYAATSFTRTQVIYSRTWSPYLNVANEIPIEMWLHFIPYARTGSAISHSAERTQHTATHVRHTLLDNSHDVDEYKKNTFFFSSFVSCSLNRAVAAVEQP